MNNTDDLKCPLNNEKRGGNREDFKKREPMKQAYGTRQEYNTALRHMSVLVEFPFISSTSNFTLRIQAGSQDAPANAEGSHEKMVCRSWTDHFSGPGFYSHVFFLNKPLKRALAAASWEKIDQICVFMVDKKYQ